MHWPPLCPPPNLCIPAFASSQTPLPQRSPPTPPSPFPWSAHFQGWDVFLTRPARSATALPALALLCSRPSSLHPGAYRAQSKFAPGKRTTRAGRKASSHVMVLAAVLTTAGLVLPGQLSYTSVPRILTPSSAFRNQRLPNSSVPGVRQCHSGEMSRACWGVSSSLCQSSVLTPIDQNAEQERGPDHTPALIVSLWVPGNWNPMFALQMDSMPFTLAQKASTLCFITNKR